MKPVPFFAQEHPESCVPACLRMILAAYQITRSEPEIYSCCQTDTDGTLPNAAAQCARMFGFEATVRRVGGIGALQERLESSDLHAILFVNLAPLTGINVFHAVILQEVVSRMKQVRVTDPAFPPNGERIWMLDQFEIGWSRARYQAILISPPVRLTPKV